MKYYPFIYASMEDMEAAVKGEAVRMNSDGYFVRLSKDEKPTIQALAPAST